MHEARTRLRASVTIAQNSDTRPSVTCRLSASAQAAVAAAASASSTVNALPAAPSDPPLLHAPGSWLAQRAALLPAATGLFDLNTVPQFCTLGELCTSPQNSARALS